MSQSVALRAAPTLSVVVVLWGRDHNLTRLVPSLHTTLRRLGLRAKVIVALGPGNEAIGEEASRLGASVVATDRTEYGEILREGLREATGDLVITMDADFSHRPSLLRALWAHRNEGEMLIASRYVPGAHAEMPLLRRSLSRILNFFYRKILSLPFRDLSSGLRMYRRRVLEDIGLPRARGLDVLPEMVAKAFSRGWKIAEVPFWYRGAKPWTRTRMVRLGLGYLRTLEALFALRNSIRAADYDHRAFDSWIPLQRYWQRRRFRIILDLIGEADRVLDVGCGTSRIIQATPQIVGMDVALPKLRWVRAPGRSLVQGTMNRLPFANGVFDGVICSEVIEHIPRGEVRLDELARVIRPGGMLVLGTPDYARRRWRALEWLYRRVFPGGYCSEHINQYTNEELASQLTALGLEVLCCRYVGGSEMIFQAQVPAVESTRERIPTRAQQA